MSQAAVAREAPPLTARRSVEALRSGVPSASAVHTLGSGQEVLEHKFRELIHRAWADPQRPVKGMLVRAGFGEGKSHLLTCLEHIALQQGYAVSRVVVSKETPLHVPAKVLASAVETLRVPNTVGHGLDEVALLLRHRLDSSEFRQLVEDLRGSQLDARFAATLYLFEQGAQSEELVDRIVRFWSGDKLTVSEIRQELRNLGEATRFRLESIKARELALQTFRFLPALIRAAGLRGWVLLIDEVELIGRYARLSRGRAYAELIRWLGEVDPIPGLVGVAAITSDFSREVLYGDKLQDMDQMGPYLQGRDPQVCGAAEQGMHAIHQALELVPPNDDLLRRTYAQLRHLHAEAYGWTPPDVPWPEVLGSMPMRTYVRAWINAWDVQRLYPQQRPESLSYAISPIRTEYAEEAGLGEEGGDA